MAFTSQWEMSMVGYVHESKAIKINAICTANRPCGIGKEFGLGKNKGGMQVFFQYADRCFNFIGCHLVHGAYNRIARDEMMEEILKGIRAEREEFDPDVFNDYNFIIGDLNYRMETTFEEMHSNNQVIIAHTLLD